MDAFVKSIKRKYAEKMLQFEEQWPPAFSGEKTFKLELMQVDKKEGFQGGFPQTNTVDEKQPSLFQVDLEQLKKKRSQYNPILHHDLFKPDHIQQKPVRKVIVEGNPGIGKTTLCTMLTEEWAKGENLTQFDCVLLLPLRERSVSTATTLPQLFKLLHSSERIRTSVIEELEEREGEGVLIIADGWDELDSSHNSKGSFLYNLFFGCILPFACVLLTSRPSASAPLHDLPTVDRLVEVVGLNEENVKQYIESEFEKCPEKASSLIEQLENNPAIQSVCSVPLNCVIICNLWHTLDQKLPSTLTELYIKIILNVILRDIKKRGLTVLSLENFDLIPDHLQEKFWLICKFAYESLLRDQIVFLENELNSFFPEVVDSRDQFLCFGLLQVARSLLPIGQGLSFHFAHLAIQEFLAALHFATQPTEEKLKVFEANARNSRLINLWIFFFGLGYHQRFCSRRIVHFDEELFDQFMSAQVRNHPDFAFFRGLNFLQGLVDRVTVVDDIFLPLTSEEDRMDTLLLCHIAFESRDEILTKRLAKRMNGLLRKSVVKSIANNPHDCVSVLHVFKHTLQCSNGEIIMNGCGLTDKLLREFTDFLCSKNGDLQLEALELQFNKLTAKGVGDLFLKASASFRSLTNLELQGNRVADILPPSSYASFRSLKSLGLSGNPLGVSGIQSLETAVQAGVLSNLTELVLSYNLTDDADINGALLATFLPSVASHCLQLSKLHLAEIFGVPGANALTEAMLLLSNRESIELRVLFDNEDATAFSNSLSYSARKYPSLNKYSCYLHLEDSKLGYDGLLAIFRMLKSENCPIRKLNLSNVLTDGISVSKFQLLNGQYTTMIAKLPLFHVN